MSVLFSQIGASWAMYKTLDSSFTSVGAPNGSLYYKYAGDSTIGDFLGVYEIISVLLFMVWGASISVMGWIEGIMLWTKY